MRFPFTRVRALPLRHSRNISYYLNKNSASTLLAVTAIVLVLRSTEFPHNGADGNPGSRQHPFVLRRLVMSRRRLMEEVGVPPTARDSRPCSASMYYSSKIKALRTSTAPVHLLVPRRGASSQACCSTHSFP